MTNDEDPHGPLDPAMVETVLVERHDARDPGSAAPTEDLVGVEQPLEIRVDGEPFVVTMRTPGDDLALAAGYLFTEGLIRSAEDLASLEPLTDAMAYDPDNVVDATLTAVAAERRGEQDRQRREHLAVSACGLCGKARLEQIYRRWPEIESVEVEPELIERLAPKMEHAQTVFPRTGGVHAAALFDLDGELLSLTEDVGRHNAVDKLIGRALLAGELPWRRRVVVVSSRAGFEIVQKTLMAETPVLAAVGAASSLAVDAARRGGQTLFSFVRPGRSNRHR